MTRHHLPAKPGTVRWGHWDGSLPPVLTIRSGDTVTIDTLSGEPEDLPDAISGFTIVPGHREVLDAGYVGPGPHFLTGPIAIEGAEPGDVLEVRIHEIELRQDWGWNLQVPLRGTLPEDFPELRRLHVPLDRKNNRARMPWGQELALEPFFGNFGVAPPLHWGRLSSKEPRVFGGNMDNKELGAGTTTYFPVFVDGALFSAGDGHALQGDGEVCLTAIETALTGTFEFIVRTDMKLDAPARGETRCLDHDGLRRGPGRRGEAGAARHDQADRRAQWPVAAGCLYPMLDRGRPARDANGRRQQRHPLRAGQDQAAAAAVAWRKRIGAAECRP